MMSKKVLATAAAIFTIFNAAAKAEGGPKVLGGLAQISCAKLLKIDHDTPNAMPLLVDQWFLGFISGLNSGQKTFKHPRFDLTPIDGQKGAIWPKVQSFCAQHPELKVFYAGADIIRDLDGVDPPSD